jgi:CO dehydrogenase maturation factor
MVIVVEPTTRSLGTAAQIKKLAEDIGLTRIWLVGNRIRNDDDSAFVAAESMGMPVLGYLPEDPRVVDADRAGTPVYAAVPALRAAAARIADALDDAALSRSPGRGDEG